MRFEVVVFDFDGTLVDSAAAKYQAFFQLFPNTPEHRAIVAAVLQRDPDGSRYEVIPRMIALMAAQGLALPAGHDGQNRIASYAALVAETVAAAPERAGATPLLRRLRGHCAVYISSQTPEPLIRELVLGRGWGTIVDGVFGYPRDKAATVAEMIARHRIAAPQLAVVGDGESDERAATNNGCPFFPVRGPDDLQQIAARLVEDHV